MKNIFKSFIAIFLLGSLFSACDKTDTLPHHSSGTAPVLTTDVSTFTAAPSDSDNSVITFSWTSPKYATDSSSVKYIIQVDSAGGDFSKAQSKTVTGTLSKTFIAKEFNAMLLGLGFDFGVSYGVDVRIISSYGNNNDQKVSNTITLQATPYVVPAKVLPPQNGTLYIIGSATAGWWINPVPVPGQQFTKIDSLTYQGTFYLKGGGAYDILPTNGSWSEKYNISDPNVPNINSGGDFQYSTGSGSDISAPAATGMYKIFLDFQHGTFTVTPVNIYTQLYVPGDYQGWAPDAAPALASLNADNLYEGYVNVPTGGTYEFKITSNPDWNHTIYGDGGGGTLSTSGGNITFPGAGYYKLNVDLNSNNYSLISTTWGVIGSFAGSGWSSDVDMASSTDNGNTIWTATVTIADGDEFKFRANHDWGLNYGDNGGDGSLEQNGGNLKGWPAGTYTVTLYLNNAGYYTYKLVKQ